jgi:hypothetical protein
MAGIAVGQFSRTAVDSREKCRGERRNRPQIAEVAIDFRGDPCRVRIRTVVTLQKSGQIGEPHSSRNTLTGNVSVRHKDLGTALQKRREIPGEKAGRENLACEL